MVDEVGKVSLGWTVGPVPLSLYMCCGCSESDGKILHVACIQQAFSVSTQQACLMLCVLVPCEEGVMARGHIGK